MKKTIVAATMLAMFLLVSAYAVKSYALPPAEHLRREEVKHVSEGIELLTGAIKHLEESFKIHSDPHTREAIKHAREALKHAEKVAEETPAEKMRRQLQHY